MAAWGFVLLLVFAAIPLGCLGGLIVLWVLVLKRRHKRGEMSGCGKCGYAVEGLQGWMCPECGSDLRRVGIVTPRQKGMPGPLVFVLLWTLLLPIPAFVAAGFAAVAGPQKQINGQRLSLTPASNAYGSIDLDVPAGGRANPDRPIHVHMYGVSSGYAELVVNPATMQFTTTPHYGSWWFGGYRPETPTTGPAITPAEVEHWLNHSGMNLTNPAAEAPPIFNVIQHAATTPANLQGFATGQAGFTSPSSSTYTYHEPRVWPFVATLAAAAVLYVAGLLYYFRIRSRLHRDPLTKPQPAIPPHPAAEQHSDEAAGTTDP